MTPAELLKPILSGGVRSVNFFNGRLLSGEDMSREQEANRETHKMLGRAIGDGIAYGFEVSRAAGSGTSALVTIQPGLALNRNGQTLRLSSPINLSLVRPQSTSGTAADTGFSSCTPFQSGVYVSGSGVYLLTVSPARGKEGRAAVSGLQNSAADCNTKYLVDGLQFRLIQLDLTVPELNDQNHLRNLVAYKCFGIEELSTVVTDPFGPELNEYGLLDRLRPDRLTDCDVPLGVVYWTASDGISFIDAWSVRRRPSRSALSLRAGFADRQLSEAEAMLLQFQDQVESMRLPGNQPEFVVATEYFRYLPPVGLLPLTGIAGSRGFDYLRFFGGLTWNPPVFIEGAKLESLILSSLSYPPIDPSAKTLIWLYWVRENIQSLNTNTSNFPQAYLVFANGYIPYRGDARFDLSHANYSNYS